MSHEARAASAARSRGWVHWQLKEFMQLRRDRLTLAMMAALPVVQLLLFGFAIDTDVRHVPTIVFDQDRSAASRDFAQQLQSHRLLRPHGEVRTTTRSRARCARVRRKVALVVPPGLSGTWRAVGPQRCSSSSTDRIRRPSRAPSTARLRSSQARAADMMVEHLRRAGEPPVEPMVRLEPTTWYNPELKTAVFVVPGLVGVILTMTMVMLTSMADRTRARARHAGAAHRLAAQARGAHHRQDRAVRGHRLRADDADARARAHRVRRAVRGLGAAALPARVRCSSPRTSRWACSSAPSPRRSSKPCRCASSSSCRTSSSPASASRARACPSLRSG